MALGSLNSKAPPSWDLVLVAVGMFCPKGRQQAIQDPEVFMSVSALLQGAS